MFYCIASRRVTISRGRVGFGFSLSGNAPVFIRSVDPNGAAARAGLRAGDYIMELNGLNVRNSTHSHVVRLLKGSGTHPSLLVAPLPSAGHTGLAGTVGTGQTGQVGGGGKRESVHSLSGAPGASDIRRTSNAFKHKVGDKNDVMMMSSAFANQMEQVLLQGERDSVLQQLTQFSRHKYVLSM